MNLEEQEIIALCKEFARQADELEARGFEDTSYRENGFESDFNALFEQYAHGDNNRTLSGLNFGQPSRYNNLNSAVSIHAIKKNKSRYEVTFTGEYQWQSVQFIVEKKETKWKLIRYKTSPGKTPEGKEIWRSHKL
ncbi:hypothetical protein [Microbulbifer spongiae]|uniref:NTF2 fold immunity protein domain-containing protein n=1 Tax=Microbulbifer spongiae TaxID=2944933 RepID=A0ABY9EAW3_9GAMM|nr:hypothetical protein [Microbulbifer sp. MI-G]WKD49812.1 hypothetical protein M8T91_18295 [Microbulbifer sp. MI-G]